jgi:hypothetical protein
MVPDLVSNISQVLAVLDQEASIAMSERVGLPVRQPRAPEEWTPDVLPKGTRCDGLAGSVRE